MDQGQKPVNPYAPPGAPYAAGSNTPPPSFAMPAVPNTSASDPAYTSFSTSASPVFTQSTPPEKPKFFTKKFIIAASIGLALILAAVITGLILQNNRNNNSGNTQTRSYSSAFHRLANYLISGNDTSEKLSGEYDYANNDYAILSAIGTENNLNQPYFTGAENLAVQFAEAYNQERNISLADLANLIYNGNENITGFQPFDYQILDYVGNIEFLNLYSSYPPASDEQILDYYVANTLNEQISNRISPFAASKYLTGRYYAGSYNDYAKNLLNMLDIYNAHGCIAEKTLDANCINGIDYSDDEQTSRNNFISASTQLESYTPASIARDLLSHCWDIQNYASQEGALNE